MLDAKTVRCPALVSQHSRQAPGPTLTSTSYAGWIDITQDGRLKTRDIRQDVCFDKPLMLELCISSKETT